MVAKTSKIPKIKIGDMVRYGGGTIYIVVPLSLYLESRRVRRESYSKDAVGMFSIHMRTFQWSSASKCSGTVIGRASKIELMLYGL